MVLNLLKFAILVVFVGFLTMIAMLFGAGFLVIFHYLGGILNLGYGPLFIFDGLVYMLAHCRGHSFARSQ